MTKRSYPCCQVTPCYHGNRSSWCCYRNYHCYCVEWIRLIRTQPWETHSSSAREGTLRERYTILLILKKLKWEENIQRFLFGIFVLLVVIYVIKHSSSRSCFFTFTDVCIFDSSKDKAFHLKPIKYFGLIVRWLYTYIKIWCWAKRTKIKSVITSFTLNKYM